MSNLTQNNKLRSEELRKIARKMIIELDRVGRAIRRRCPLPSTCHIRFRGYVVVKLIVFKPHTVQHGFPFASFRDAHKCCKARYACLS